MIRTREDALELVRIHGLVTEIPTPGVQSLAEAVVGGALEGSWRSHAKGRLIYRLGRQLRASDEVLSLRLIHGRITFVDRDLWPAVYRIVMDSMRRRQSLEGLSSASRGLLTLVEREAQVKVAKEGLWTKAREALEVRLLVHSSEAQNVATGRHEAVLQSWRAWATEGLRGQSSELTYEAAVDQLRRGNTEEDVTAAGLGAWVL